MSFTSIDGDFLTEDNGSSSSDGDDISLVDLSEIVLGLRRRQVQRASRPSFKVLKKTSLRRCGRSQAATKKEMAALESSRDLSPSDRLACYLAAADETLEDVIEKIAEKAGAARDIFQDSAVAAKQKLQDSAEAAAQITTEMVHEAAEMVVDKISQWRACHFERIPQWLRDNEYLLFGHRPELPSFLACFQSIFRIHTETGNIWTHMIGFFTFLILTIIFYVKPFCDYCNSDILLGDKLIFLCFFVGAMLCLLCSTLFHTVCCHSPWVSDLFQRLDYAGITFLIVGSTIPWLYFAYYCHFYTKLTYIIVISVLGLITSMYTFSKRFSAYENRCFRAAVFVALGLCAALPTVQLVIETGFMKGIKRGNLTYMGIMGVLYLIGAALYALRIPERFMPGKCDIWFQSHQLFHLFVLAAALVHYRGIFNMAVNRIVMGTECENQSA